MLWVYSKGNGCITFFQFGQGVFLLINFSNLLTIGFKQVNAMLALNNNCYQGFAGTALQTNYKLKIVLFVQKSRQSYAFEVGWHSLVMKLILYYIQQMLRLTLWLDHSLNIYIPIWLLGFYFVVTLTDFFDEVSLQNDSILTQTIRCSKFLRCSNLVTVLLLLLTA